MRNTTMRALVFALTTSIWFASGNAWAATAAELVGAWNGKNWGFAFRPDGSGEFAAVAGVTVVGAEITYAIDFSKTPATLDFVEKKAPEHPTRAVIELNGDVLKIGWNDARRAERPESMAAASFVIEMKREKEKTPAAEKR